MIIGQIEHPEKWGDWDKIKAFLEPAAKRGGVPLMGEHHQLWAVYDGRLLGAATTRLTADNFGEVILVGGVHCRKWIATLDKAIGAWMRAEGKQAMRAYGRKGWARVLKGWRSIGEQNGVMGYERMT